MNVVDITATRNYQVIIGSNLLRNAATHIQQVLSPSKALIVTDSNVAPLYAQQLADSLSAAAIKISDFCIPAEECSKSLENFGDLLNVLAKEQFTRTDVIIALGGGVVGDLAGFSAACYMRGIPYIQIPTTLLAMVDSSVGGKTAINLPDGKNLAGAFHQPSLVLCDVDVLNTLDQEHFRDGCAEIIKYGVLFDAELVDVLLRDGITFNRQDVITQCVKFKRNVVAEDEFDNNTRQLLSLGHTVGHAIENLSDYRISHGNAIAIGMCIVTRASASHGLCSAVTKSLVEETISNLGLPTKSDYSIQDIVRIIAYDKKRTGDTINLILPEKIGHCIAFPIKTNQLETFLKAGM